MKTVYHKASPVNRELISNKGLIPYRGEQWIDENLKNIKSPAIFATNSENKEDWFDSGYDDDVWEIDVKSLENVEWFADPYFDWDDKYKHIFTYSAIPIKALTLIYKGSGELITD